MIFQLFYILLFLAIFLGLGFILTIGYIVSPSRVKRMVQTFFYIEGESQ